MKKNNGKNKGVVQPDHEGQKVEKTERLWFVQFGQLRRHSRVLYIALDPTVVRLYRLKKGDILKYMLLELRRAPAVDQPIPGLSESESIGEGEL